MLSKKIEGELTSLDCAAMEKHVERCDRCRGACDAVHRALSACARVREDEPVPETVQQSVRRAVRAWVGAA